MITRNLLIAATALSLVAIPAMAQTKKIDTETNGHHYNGGPKTEVPHHMGKKDTGVTTGRGRPQR